MAPPLDLLSNLPLEIIAEILCHVPIREAVKTSVLSHRWRYLWCSIPDLLFQDNCVNLPSTDSPSFNYKFVSFVSRVLLLRRGPVRKFEVTGYSQPEFSDISQWLTFVSRNGIEELSLDFGYSTIAPSSLFQCDKLRELCLSDFESLKLPVSFDGFMFLKSLVLESVSIGIRSLEKLISGCPLLRNLELYDCHTEVLKIHAPLLRNLHLEGKFEGFVLEETPVLEEMLVIMSGAVTEQSCTLVQSINQVPFLKKLIGLEYFFQYWSGDKVPTTLAITHNLLRFIKLSIDFKDSSEIRLLIQLMSSSPILKELVIKGVCREGSPEGHGASDSDFWSEAHDGLGCQLLRLEKASVRTTSGSCNEIGFVKFVLLNSPALEMMTVTLPSDLKHGRTKILLGLLRCRRASTLAEVEVSHR